VLREGSIMGTARITIFIETSPGPTPDKVQVKSEITTEATPEFPKDILKSYSDAIKKAVDEA
jgi:hypothetical protein